jgi:hypothetical protein
MQNENEQLNYDDLAEVLKGAHLRRSADLGKWVGEFFRRRREERMARTAQHTKSHPELRRSLAT